MSWFKKGKNDSKTSNDDQPDGRNRADTDPQTCLEVFQNHWKQALLIISRDKNGNSPKGQNCSNDELEAVLQNFEQMITLLASEEGLDENGQGMPGPILHYLLEEKIFDGFCDWCLAHAEHGEQLQREQLRMFEQLISQSHQLLLIHKAIIQPLLKLLSLCSDGVKSHTVENQLVLVLHQLCVCISQETLILESFLNTSANHGPTKFLIFSLLIPYIHREGQVGQLARDALLLIMTISSKYPHIGLYIAENSDFCPVLATGLSGLYSSLPRKIPCYTDTWHQFTQDDINHIPELQMFLNSLEFCNAVTQVGHPAIKSQLMKYIYDGFLVPVLGPALHQINDESDDISGLPLPLLDSPMFSNSREEVIAATAYLELFLRKASEPELIKTFLRFILTEQNDEIIILDSLVTRINSSSKPLCVVSLSLFRTLVDLNCEDVMFQLLFKYLIPCTHVMVSQRRNVKDLDFYSKSAERFLSLRPLCCDPDDNESESQSATSTVRSTTMAVTEQKSVFPTISVASQLKNYETDYSEYLAEARMQLERCAKACNAWTYPYDGELPSPDVFSESFDDSLQSCDIVCNSDRTTTSVTFFDSGTESNNSKGASVELLSHGDSLVTSPLIPKSDIDSPSSSRLTADDEVFHTDTACSYQSKSSDLSEVLSHFDLSSSNDNLSTESEDVSQFLSYLDGCGTPPDQEESLELSMMSLDSLLNSMCSLSSKQTSASQSCDNSLTNSDKVQNNSMLSNIERKNGDSQSGNISKTSNPSSVDSKKATCDGTTFEVIEDSGHDQLISNDAVLRSPSPQDATSFIDISMSHCNKTASVQPSNLPTSNLSEAVNDSKTPEIFPRKDSNTSDSISRTDSNASNTIPRKLSKDEGFSKSVSFNLSPSMSSMQSMSQSSSAAAVRVPSEVNVKLSSKQPNIGSFLMALFLKLDGMMQNSLPVNLLLTGVISRLAAYPQPLLRSFLLSHNLVFQPTVKSLIQVLTSVRQKVDHFALTVPTFDTLLLRARQNLASREENWKIGAIPSSPYLQNTVSPIKSQPIIENNTKEKRKVSLTDLLFKRSPNTKKKTTPSGGKGGPQLQIIQGGRGFRYINYQNRPQEMVQNPMDSPKVRNAVYCAIVLEEFLKELAALSQEQAVLHVDEGYLSH